MKIEKSHSLKPYNTFGLEYKAENLLRITNEQDIYEVLVEEYKPIKILGGGSNILLTKDIEGYLLKNELKGIHIIDEDEDHVLAQVASGEYWHNFVLWSISHNLGGLENLSLIPGTVGAAPMQNIGAYGVEQEAVFHSLQAINLETGYKKTFFKYECGFGYRESVFKNELKDKYFITHVNYLLKKRNHVLNLEYGAIKTVLHEKGISDPTIQDVSDAVIEIRNSKLPNPKKIGNAGSFFKNPVVPKSIFLEIKSDYPEVPFYPIDENLVKIPAGWLIEKSGFKGIRNNNIGVHKDQALVLVNYGDGSGQEILDLSKLIQKTVFEKFNIEISTEVNQW